MKEKIDLTIIVPSRNEEMVIEKSLITLSNKVKTPHKIIVVDDSIDDTKKVIRGYMKKHKNVALLNDRPRIKSFGNGLLRGYNNTKTEYFVVFMADMSDKAETINKMYKEINKGYDIICGSRYMKGGVKIGGPKMQNFFSKWICKALHIFIGIPTKDASNAFKMYRKSVLKKEMFNKKAGVEASMEIVIQAYFFGAKIREIPTIWVGRKKGTSKFKSLERSPKYLRIFLWSLMYNLKKRLGMDYQKVVPWN